VLLKARPTRAQLADRLRPPVPEGLELYLDAADISGNGWLDKMAALLGEHRVPADFAWVVEGPLRSLDGGYFDLARDADADREVIARVVECAERIGAAAVVIHCIAPVGTPGALTMANRRRAMERAEAMLAHYASVCLARELVPTIENVPPVARMRESAMVHSLIGMAPEDVVHFVDRVPGLRATCDTSHARLFLNALAAEPARQAQELRPVVEFAAGSSAARTLDEYIAQLGRRVYEAHIANAAGLLNEGLPYAEGEVDLDAALASLLQLAEFVVTEPIEPDPNRGDRMRAMAERIAAVRARTPGDEA
jgi:sugar phosphate isomerase/epimerase